MSKQYKPKPPCDKKKSRCCIGCVECSPENDGSNNAAVIQSFSQSAVSMFMCGAGGPDSNFHMNLAADSDETKVEDSDKEDAIIEGKTFADALITFIQKKVQDRESKADG